MIVLEEEQFSRHGIKRTNASRIAKEEAARAKRSSDPIKNHNQAQNHSTLSQPRSNLSGGSMEMWWLLLVGAISHIKKAFFQL